MSPPINPVRFTWKYFIHRDLANPNSQFYRQQWGINGWISGADLLNGMRRHEAGALNSHLASFVGFWTHPNNDWRFIAESLVAGPSQVAGFDGAVRARGSDVASELRTLYDAAPEPCGPNMDAACARVLGDINWLGLPPE